MSANGAGPAVGVSAEQKEDLKRKVREKLKELGVDKQIHELVAAKAGPVGATKPAVSRQEAITQLKGKGVIDQLVKSLANVGPNIGDPSSRQRNAVQVRLKAVTGLGFYAKKPPEPHEQLVVCAELFGHRLRSSPVPAAASALLEAVLAVDLPRALQSPEQLLLQKQPLQLLLMRTFPHAAEDGGPPELERHNLESEVLGAALYDWREAWCSPGQAFSLELPLVIGGTAAAADGGSGAVVGSLQLECLAQAAQDSGGAGLRLAAEALRARQAEEREAHAQALARFRALTAAVACRSDGSERRLVVAAEDGREFPVCSFVRPLQLGRCLASPQQACHFVSLIEPKLDWDTDVHPGPVGHFLASTHTILAAGLASAEEKAVLLCSLLQGFGMEAYVAVGSHKHSPAERLWVATLAGGEATFWDVSGHRSSPSGQANGKPSSFLAVDWLFSHRRLYVNLQAGKPLAAVSFALEDAACWREVAVPPADAPSLPAQRFELQRPVLDTVAMEVKLEAAIKQQLAAQRAQLLGSSSSPGGMTWDDSLAFLLMPTLASLERDAIWGPGCWAAEDPQAAIKRAMPAGATLLGVPHHSRCLVAPRIVRALLREQPVRELLAIRSADAAFALRVRISSYPEHTSSCWLMLAVRSSQPLAAPAAP